MEEENKEDREFNFMVGKNDMAKQRMIIYGSVLVDVTFYINGELDPTFDELSMEETRFFLFVLKYVYTFEFVERNDTVMTSGMIDTNTLLYRSRECVGKCTFDFKRD